MPGGGAAGRPRNGDQAPRGRQRRKEQQLGVRLSQKEGGVSPKKAVPPRAAGGGGAANPGSQDSFMEENMVADKALKREIEEEVVVQEIEPAILIADPSQEKRAVP
ncbi:hypothetical protein GDO86_013014 [Hymenochirus boettgeri]|uniref:Uncharacterized protein n=1 Tax=Hymenochirus boettgeri TaxID=247094 RepID=A0A8T2IV24_9PIPI|nr:hypothetical protein GDO86_013014 [Hymenochirus boettgeri]